MQGGNGHILVMGVGRNGSQDPYDTSFFLLMPIYLGNGHSLVTALLGKTTKAVRVYLLLFFIFYFLLGRLSCVTCHCNKKCCGDIRLLSAYPFHVYKRKKIQFAF